MDLMETPTTIGHRRKSHLCGSRIAAGTLILILSLGSKAYGGDPTADTSRRALDTWLGGIQGAALATVTSIEDEAVRKVLPSEHFYAVRFEGASHAPIPPDPLQLTNLIWVQPDGAVKNLKDTAALRLLFSEKIAPVYRDSQARDVVKGYLRLAEELTQDGSYRFFVAEQSISVHRAKNQLVAIGRAVATEGGTGGVSATLTFDTSGKLVNATSTTKVHPNWRNRLVRRPE